MASERVFQLIMLRDVADRLGHRGAHDDQKRERNEYREVLPGRRVSHASLLTTGSINEARLPCNAEFEAGEAVMWE